MSKKPSFLTKQGMDAVNKKKVVFNIVISEEESTEFIMDWTIKHSNFYQIEAKRTGKDSLMRKISELSKFISKLDKKRRDIEKNHNSDLEELDNDVKFELLADYYDMMESSSMLFYEIINAYGRIEFENEWSEDDAVNLHTMITGSYTTEALFGELQKLFGLILGNTPSG